MTFGNLKQGERFILVDNHKVYCPILVKVGELEAVEVKTEKKVVVRPEATVYRVGV